MSAVDKRVARIEIENFQSHAHTVLEPAPGLTVITGPSDQGKSAVLRALRWVYLNEPTGTDFIRVGTSRARVAITLRDGTRVIRERTTTGSVNRYVVEAPGAEPVILEGFGREVPEPVREALGIRLVDLAGDKVHLGYAAQLEGPFLVGDKASVRAEAVGRLTGHHLLTRAAAAAASDRMAAEREVRRAKEEVEQLEQALQEYADLPLQEAALARLDEAIARTQAHSDRLEELRRFRDHLGENRRQRQAVDATLAALEETDEAARRLANLTRQAEQFAALDRVRDLLGRNVEAMARVELVLSSTADIDSAQAATLRITQALGRLEAVTVLRSRLHNIAAALSHAEVVLARSGRVAEAAETVRRVGDALSRLDSLRRLQEAWRSNRQACEAAERRLAGLRGVSTAAEGVERVRTAHERLEALQRFKEQIADWKRRMRPVLQDLKRAEEEAQVAAARYREVLLTAGVCPTCGQPVNEQTLVLHAMEG